MWKIYNLENDHIFKSSNNLNEWKNFLNQFENKKSNNLFFLLFQILKFRNIGRSRFGPSKCWLPPKKVKHIDDVKNIHFA